MHTTADMLPNDGQTRKPRLALMGEFSAGKSTLSNILMGAAPLPMKVTATRLPPVLVTYGAPSAHKIGTDGTRDPIDLDEIDQVEFDGTRYIHITMQADTLQLCDLIDMPGISDPNMPKDMWESIVGEADHVVWCTHATQAWRQSEAAIWEVLSACTKSDNLLLITQFDKLRTERDRERVLKRVQRETDSLFNHVYPVSLLDALNAEDDKAAWENSGVAAFSEHLIELLIASADGKKSRFDAQARQKRIETAQAGDIQPQNIPVDAAPHTHVMPRRVKVHASAAAKARPHPVRAIVFDD